MALAQLRRSLSGFHPSTNDDAARLKSVGDGCEVICFPVDAVDDRVRLYAQNRLYWWWIGAMSKTQVNEYAGWEKLEWHGCLKREVLSPAKEVWAREDYEQGNADDLGWAGLIDSIRTVWMGNKALGEKMFNHVISELSTRTLLVKEFAKYLTAVAQYCAQRGIRLPVDAELERLAQVAR